MSKHDEFVYKAKDKHFVPLYSIASATSEPHGTQMHLVKHSTLTFFFSKMHIHSKVAIIFLLAHLFHTKTGRLVFFK